MNVSQLKQFQTFWGYFCITFFNNKAVDIILVIIDELMHFSFTFAVVEYLPAV